MAKSASGTQLLGQDLAILKAVMIHGVPVNVLAKAVRQNRQTLYRRMERARAAIRRASARAERAHEEQRGVVAIQRELERAERQKREEAGRAEAERGARQARVEAAQGVAS